MPPGRRKRVPPDPPEQRQSSSSPSSTSGSDQDENLPPFFNATFATHRISPLYLGRQPLDGARLQELSKRLRDTLVGDVVRGVQVGLYTTGIGADDGALGRAGALEKVEWRWVAMSKLLGPKGEGESGSSARHGSVELGDTQDTTRERQGPQKKGRGRARPQGAPSNNKARTIPDNKVLSLELTYEFARWGALLVSDLSSGGDKDGLADRRHEPLQWAAGRKMRDNDEDSQGDSTSFAHLPLLLTRLPAPLRPVLTDFLSTTFDCRISALRQGTRSLVRSWESWLDENGLLHGSGGKRSWSLNKDVMVTLGFHVASPEEAVMPDGPASTTTSRQQREQIGLKAIDIIIPADEVARFARTGKKSTFARPPSPWPASEQIRGAKRKSGSIDDDDDDDTLSTEETRRLRRKLAGGPSEEEGWHWRRRNSDEAHSDDEEDDDDGPASSGLPRQPFTEALAAYADRHLALDLFHPGVRVQRVACDGFALSEGRFKIFSSPAAGGGGGGGESNGAAWRLVEELVEKAKGTGWSDEALRVADAAVAAGEEMAGRQSG